MSRTTRAMRNEQSSATANDEHAATWSYKTMRTAFVFLLLLSCAAPLIHFRLVDEVFESLRHPMGFLSGVHLFLRELGQLSASFPVAILAALGWSFFRPAHTLKLLTGFTAAFLVFTVAYACYALVVIRVLVPDRAT